MKCQDCIAKIEEYLEGDLNLQSTEEAFAHILLCNECKCSYEYLKQEQDALAPYLLKVKASPSLWANVEAQIRAEKQISVVPQTAPLISRILLFFNSLRFNRVLASSLAILLIGVSIGVLIHLFSKDGQLTQDFISTTGTNNSGAETEISNPTEFTRASENPEYAEPTPLKNTTVNPKSIDHKSLKTRIDSSAERQIIKAQVQKNRAEFKFIKPKINSLNNTSVSDDTQLNAAIVRVPNQPDNLEIETIKQVEKAQILLRSFRNAAYKEGEPLFDLDFDRKQARKLLENNVSLRRRAELQDNFEVKAMLDNLEPYLLDIANLRDDATANDMRAIKNRIQKQEVIASLQVY